MGSRNSESTEILLGSSSPNWSRMKNRHHPNPPFPQKVRSDGDGLCWNGRWVGGVLKIQSIGILILAWLIIVVYGSNFPVKTPLGSEFVPFWSFWVIVLYALSISIGLSFHFYPSTLGVIVSGVLQGITLVFSSYFSVIAFSALEIHARLEKNEITRSWGGLLYGTIVGANAGILLTSLVLILAGVRDAAKNACKYNLTWRQIGRNQTEKGHLTIHPQENCV